MRKSINEVLTKYGDKAINGLTEFVKHRGGWKGITSATIKGILSSLPLVGKTIEEVVFNSKDIDIVQKSEEALVAYEQKINSSVDENEAVANLLFLIEELLNLIEVEKTKKNHLIKSALNQLSVINQNFKEFKKTLNNTKRETSEIINILKGSYTSKDNIELLLKKSVAIFALEHILQQVKTLWPVNPIFSIYEDQSKRIHGNISTLKILFDQANVLIPIAWQGQKVEYFTKNLRNRLEIALDRHQSCQIDFQEGDFASFVSSLETADYGVYETVNEWSELVLLLIDEVKAEIIDKLRNIASLDHSQ